MDAPAVELRRAAATDYVRLIALEAASDARFPAGRLPPGGPPFDRGIFDRSVAAGLTWFAWRDAEPVGYATAKILAEHLHLLGFGVEPAHARRGIGTRLLDRVKTDARELHLPGITLTTFADLPFNAPYYAKRGFTEIPAAEQAPEIADILANERAAGLTHRIAMRWTTTP